MTEAAQHLRAPWRFAAAELCEPRGPVDRHGHVGVHEQAQPGLCYIGIVARAGRLSAAQLRGLAAIAARRGSGTLRLTVWQNLILSDVARAQVPETLAEIEALGLATSASAIRAGLVACTGNAGCKFALADTKRHALALADYLEPRVALDAPINIHLTGCPNSCAQHYVGDIGLLATKVDCGEDEVEGYHLVAGGGSGAAAGLGREICRDIPADQLPRRLERGLGAYLAHRAAGESFRAFATRHSVDELAALFGEAGAAR
jgi:ferredoxin-nitrite reductase